MGKISTKEGERAWIVNKAVREDRLTTKCPFPEESVLAITWHLCRLDSIIAAMDLVLKQARVDPIETPFMKWGRP